MHFVLQRSFMAVPLSYVGCLVSTGAGLLAVWHYTSTYQTTISGGQGAMMGFWAGAVATLVGSGLSHLLSLAGLLPDLSSVRMDRDIPAVAQHSLFQILGYLLIVTVYAVLGLIGGVLGAAVFKKGSAYQDDSTASDFI